MLPLQGDGECQKCQHLKRTFVTDRTLVFSLMHKGIKMIDFLSKVILLITLKLLLHIKQTAQSHLTSKQPFIHWTRRPQPSETNLHLFDGGYLVQQVNTRLCWETSHWVTNSRLCLFCHHWQRLNSCLIHYPTATIAGQNPRNVTHTHTVLAESVHTEQKS